MSHTLAPPTGPAVWRGTLPVNSRLIHLKITLHLTGFSAMFRCLYTPSQHYFPGSQSWQHEVHNTLLTLPEVWSPVASCFDCEYPMYMRWGKCPSFSCDPQRQWGISMKQTVAHAKAIRHPTSPSGQFDACISTMHDVHRHLVVEVLEGSHQGRI